MQDMITNVYNTLKTSTAKLQKKVAEYKALEEEAKKGIYSREHLGRVVYPKMTALRNAIEADKEAAISSAKEIVLAYQEELRDKDNLHPEDLTEDVKLFTAGITLKARDIEAILARNQDNATMTQLALRYAEENGIELGSGKKRYYGHQAEIQEANGVTTAISYYSRWIDKPNAGEMLDKFFNVTEE